MTIDQVASRAAKKRNNKARRELPLFADQLQPDGALSDWLTTEDEQRARIERQRQQNDACLARHDDLDLKFLADAAACRAVIAECRPELIAELDSQVASRFWLRTAVYQADFWWRRLVELAPDAAHANCPIAYSHEVEARFHDFCPCCRGDIRHLQQEQGQEQTAVQLGMFR